MLRIARIVLLTMIPTLAIGTLVSACDDDTSATPVGADMSGVVHDMTPVVHDMAQHGD